jgi:hypothetical protein
MKPNEDALPAEEPRHQTPVGHRIPGIVPGNPLFERAKKKSTQRFTNVRSAGIDESVEQTFI